MRDLIEHFRFSRPGLSPTWLSTLTMCLVAVAAMFPVDSTPF